MYNRIVFFQPRTKAGKNYQNSIGKEQIWTPWFALILSPASRLYGLEPYLIDARVGEGIWEKQVAALSSKDILAVTTMTGYAILDAIKASNIAKTRGAYIVWGGPHVTLFPYETLSQSPADAVIPGFGFLPFLDFMSIIISPNKFTPSFYKGIIFKNPPLPITENEIVPNLDYDTSSELPEYDLDLISDWSPYLNSDIAIANRTVNLITSEGCPRSCTFCSEPTTSKRTWYTRSVTQSVKTAIKLIQRTNANGLKLHDPNFFHSVRRSLDFAHSLTKIIPVPWAATMYPEDLIKMSDGILKEFKKLGLSRVLIGLESPLKSIVKLAGKQYDPDMIPVIAKRLANVGIRGMFTFIVGWPQADFSHYEMTLQCAYEIKRIWIEHQSKIHFLEPWPGTPIYHLLRKNGFNFPNTLDEWAKIDYYQAQFMEIHNVSIVEDIRNANIELSPYVDA